MNSFRNVHLSKKKKKKNDEFYTRLEDIEKELTMGMTNFEYNMVHRPILFSKVSINLMYVLSHKHISIQASDFIAGETRRIVLSDLDNLTILKKLEYLDIKLFLP